MFSIKDIIGSWRVYVSLFVVGVWDLVKVMILYSDTEGRQSASFYLNYEQATVFISSFVYNLM